MSRTQPGRIRGLFLLTTINLASSAFASGSYSTGAGGDQANQSYNLGKAAFYKKLICSSCPLAASEPNAAKAAELVQQLAGKPEFAQRLTDSEREAIIHYLKRRYDLN